MNLGKYIFGIREEYLLSVSDDERKGQFLSYNILALMFMILVIVTTFSGVCFGLLIFNDWYMAIFSGLLLGGIGFALLLMVLFLNLTTSHTVLYERMTGMDKVFIEYFNTNLAGKSDDELLEIVKHQEKELRSQSLFVSNPRFHPSNIFVSAIKVLLILILSLIVSSGMQLFAFRNELNDSFAKMRVSTELQEIVAKYGAREKAPNDAFYQLAQDAEWRLQMLRNDSQSNPFLLIDCHSPLMAMETLSQSIGGWRVFFDVCFAFLFMIPFFLVKKSIRFAGGAYLRESTILDINTSMMFFLLTRRKCQEIKHTIGTEYVYDFKNFKAGQ
jgi:hypothetical protein